MSLIECIDKCEKLDTFEKLNIGDYVRYLYYNNSEGVNEWQYREGGYFKKHDINIKNIPYIVLYSFKKRRTFVISKYKILSDNTTMENLFFFDPTIPNKIPPIPNYKNPDIKDQTMVKMEEKINELRNEVKYYKAKLLNSEKENKILKMTLKNKDVFL